jgi:hypothetical protein
VTAAGHVQGPLSVAPSTGLNCCLVKRGVPDPAEMVRFDRRESSARVTPAHPARREAGHTRRERRRGAEHDRADIRGAGGRGHAAD